ncbi:hypothetical protein [Amycolatopsis sp. lyj-108]|uniref:hypothetical protein n=1 Tax=Amycolatopsis sp. lyj-108 TaxID=2789286 RepID=UPI00397D84ED
MDVELQEQTADNLRYMLAVDAAARADGDPVAHHRDVVEPGDELCYAAARLEQLTQPARLRPRRRPRLAAHCFGGADRDRPRRLVDVVLGAAGDR